MSNCSSLLESFTIGNRSPSIQHCHSSKKTITLCRSESIQLKLLRHRSNILPSSFSLYRRRRNHRSTLSLPSSPASHHDSNPSEVEESEEKADVKTQSKESEQAWNETLAYFREQALKMQNVSQEAYGEYSRKAMVVLKEASTQLKIQAEKARQDLSVIAVEVGEEGKEYLSTVAGNPPESVKDIVETFTSNTDTLTEISEVRDFYIGIPYGILLSFGGFLYFMITGSISAIRFGVILGGALLALSISSLRSWRNGESPSIALKGQAAIASILFLKDLRVLYVTSSLANFLTALISGSLVVFYIYRIFLDDKHRKGSNMEPGKEN